MRTTVTLDPDTAALVQEQMRRRGVSFKQAVNDAIRRGLSPAEATTASVTRSIDMGAPLVGLDRALALAADLEDEELLRKGSLRK